MKNEIEALDGIFLDKGMSWYSGRHDCLIIKKVRIQVSSGLGNLYNVFSSC